METAPATAPAAPPPTPTTTTGVIQVAAEHAELLADFYRRTWDADATAEGVRAARRAAAARNPVAPGTEPPTFLFLSAGRALGHVTTIPLRLWTGDGERPAHWIKGLMVLPEARNGPVGFYLLRQAVARLETALSMAVAPDARRLLEAAGFADLGAVPDHLRVLDPAAVLRRLDASGPAARLPRPARAAALRAGRSPVLRALAAAAFRAGAATLAAARGGTGGLHAVVLPELRPGELNRLWARVRRAVPAAPSRSAEALRTRYGEGGYRLLGVYTGGVLTGFAAVRPPRPEGDPRLNGVRVAVLSELVVPPGARAAAHALIAGAETVARALDAHALLAGATHPAARAALRRRAYLPFSGTVHLLVRDAPGAPPLPRARAAWWVTRGDGHADEVS